MFLILCSAVATFACRDIDRPHGTSSQKLLQAPQSPPVIAALTCELDGAAKTVVCSTPAVAPAGVSASVIHGATTYAIFSPGNLVRDTVSHTWQFTAHIQNLLQQSIGTPNGTSVTGVKVFVTDLHAIAGTGEVSVASADGRCTFTAPNQSYVDYDQIVASNGHTRKKLWKFDVPNTVTAVSMNILISTDFRAEQTVTLSPPDTLAAWVHSDTNLARPTATSSGNFTKRIVKVRFRSTATLVDRQLAIAFVNGTVVGGKRYADGIGGAYFVEVADDGTGSGILAAAERLTALPQVESAIFEVSLQH
jgi:hypothetical protein